MLLLFVVHSTYGAALLVLDKDQYDLLEMYTEYVRSAMDTDHEYLLVTHAGKPLTNYKDFVKGLTRRLGITDFPTCTQVRKAGATISADATSIETMAVVAEHMTHSVPASQKYYRNRHRVRQAQTVHSHIQSVIESKCCA